MLERMRTGHYAVLYLVSVVPACSERSFSFLSIPFSLDGNGGFKESLGGCLGR